jgi:hypothetical protein
MSRTLNTVVAVALLSLFPAMSLYAGTQAPNYTEDQAILIATQFLKNSPTFQFDGIEDTIELVEVYTIRMPYTWSIALKFTSRNAGYGDRSGEMVATVLTEHTMVIVVSVGEVISAVTDGAYDELTSTMQNMPKSPLKEAEDIASEWLKNAPTFSFDGIQGTMSVIDGVIAESYPEQYFITISFDCSHAGYGDRTDMMLAQIITQHEAVVVVSSNQIQSAVIDGEWDEFKVAEEANSDILFSEDAVNIAIQYLKENYHEASDLMIGAEWSVSNLTPEGLLGASTIEYMGDGWTIKVSYPVVWKPIYMVQIENTSGFTWTGSVDQSGSVTEITE